MDFNKICINTSMYALPDKQLQIILIYESSVEIMTYQFLSKLGFNHFIHIYVP